MKNSRHPWQLAVGRVAKTHHAGEAGERHPFEGGHILEDDEDRDDRERHGHFLPAQGHGHFPSGWP